MAGSVARVHRTGGLFAEPDGLLFTVRCRKPNQEYRSLLDLGLGLTDLVKTTSGNDDEVDGSSFDAVGLARKLEFFAPRVVAFNGKKAGQVFLCRQADYGLQPEVVGRTEIFVLPSTSGAARGFWDPRPWQDLAEYLKQ